MTELELISRIEMVLESKIMQDDDKLIRIGDLIHEWKVDNE